MEEGIHIIDGFRIYVNKERIDGIEREKSKRCSNCRSYSRVIPMIGSHNLLCVGCLTKEIQAANKAMQLIIKQPIEKQREDAS
jgi:hypothetical protein